MDIISKVVKILRSFYLTKKYVDNGFGYFKLAGPFIKIKIEKEKGSLFVLNGKLSFGRYFGGESATIISMGKNSRLVINGDFVLGDGVKIYISDNAELIIGGKEIESNAGITSNCLIMVYKKISIGNDLLCSWNVYISDCDWHRIGKSIPNADIYIGNHVWIGNNCSILKGSILGNNIIVSSYSRIINNNYDDNLMIGGVPSSILKHNISWQRDL